MPRQGPRHSTRPPGKPPIIPNAEEFNRRAQAYFDSCTPTEANPEPPKLGFVALALALGLNGRAQLREYGERPVYASAVKKALSVVEASYESQLRSGQPVGAIFALKQAGWSDRQDIDVRGGLGAIDYSRLTDEQLVRMAAGEHPLAVLASTAPKRLKAGRPMKSVIAGPDE